MIGNYAQRMIAVYGLLVVGAAPVLGQSEAEFVYQRGYFAADGKYVAAQVTSKQKRPNSLSKVRTTARIQPRTRSRMTARKWVDWRTRSNMTRQSQSTISHLKQVQAAERAKREQLALDKELRKQAAK